MKKSHIMNLSFRIWAVLSLCIPPAFAQSPYGWQLGTSAGTQKFTNSVDAQLGLGLQASVGRGLMPRLGASIALDYSSLPFQQTVTVPGVTFLNSREASLFGLDLLFDYSMATDAIVNPYLKAGGGLESIQVGNSRRQFYVAGIAGAGVRVKLEPQIALHLHGDYHFMEAQPLNGFAPDPQPDGYFTARIGLTFFTGKENSPDEGLESERLSVDEVWTEERGGDESQAQDAEASDPATDSSGQDQTDRFSMEDELEAEPENSAPMNSDDAAPSLVSKDSEENSSDAETTFDLSTLEARLNQLEAEYDDAPATSLGDGERTETQIETAPDDFSELEARLQLLEQEYEDAPEAAAAGSSKDEFNLAEDGAGADSAAFEQRLDRLANRYENASGTATLRADPFMNLEEESTEGSTALEQTMQMLNSEAEQTNRPPDYLNLNANAAPVDADGRQPASSNDGFTEKSPDMNRALDNALLAKTSSFSNGYENALYDFYTGRYAEAVYRLSILIEEYPNHILASNCYYWMGEAQLQANNLQDAIAAFNRVLAFEKSLKKDNALLMLGKAYMFLKRPDEARTAFNRVIAEYPTSEAVYKAQEYLRSL
ncbi:MAG: tetratricopeptide repeat protein [bacterium]